ncbi:MAG: integrase arm-type DNA-binding domain-containing protein [Brevundimonas sp.]|uniref:tyrosine-type recombinase/integrase n=1 Tax=Brevundimonas sp. TaxID=1871086 RepID=UPI002AB85070|nr:integrase arm-type DNA-binding domain-containing protein [Brevundimonas sp.]MDZ4113254.1 integrase arm-type DNA-binding domain-containing protein [Brevundimonas sp.]
MGGSVQLTTDRQVSALRAAAAPYERRVGGSRGLSLRVYPSSSKQFELRYLTESGKRRRLVLGLYPDLSLAEARAKAATMRVAVQEGLDPVGEKTAARERAREQAKAGDTLDQLAEAYWTAAEVGLHGGRRKPKRAVTIQNERSVWKNHIQGPLGGRDFTEIRRADVKAFMRTLITEKGLSAASVASIGGVLHAVLGFGVLEEKLESNAAAGLARPLALTSRERMFDDAALAVLWRAAVEASMPRTPGEKTAGVHARLEPVMGLAIQLLMLTLTRRNEVAGALKIEFDLAAKVWIIPSTRAKAKHQHVVPLGPGCLTVLKEAFALDPKSPFAFPSGRVPDQHLDPHAITRAFARTCARQKIAVGSPHDVRRSGATTLTGRYGVTRFIVGLVLGHTPNEGAAVTSVYDRHTYLPEKRSALAAWAGHLTGSSTALAQNPCESLDTPAADPSSEVEAAKARALGLVADGDLDDAVFLICMTMARRAEVAASHMDILAKAGLDLARSGQKVEIERWISGFR